MESVPSAAKLVSVGAAYTFHLHEEAPVAHKSLTLSTLAIDLLAVAVSATAVGQQVSTIDARMAGKAGDEGKCTFEVVVQGSADVQIRGSQGRLVTESGNPAQWRRLDCNEPLPYSAGNFKFKGIDGHGQQSLAAVPNSNNGVAVIHIVNNSNKNEGYTGEIEWRAGSETSWSPPPTATSGYSVGNESGRWNNGWNDADDASWSSGSYSNWNSAGSGAAAAAQACQDYVARRVSREHTEVVNVQMQPDTVTTSQRNGSLVRVKGQGQYQANGGDSGGFEFRCEYDTQTGQIVNAGYHR